MKRTYRLVSIILLSLLRRLRLYRPGVLLRNRRCCSPVGVVKSKAYFNLKRYTAVEKKGRRQKAVYHLILRQKALQWIIEQSASRKSPKSEDNFLVYRFLASSQKKTFPERCIHFFTWIMYSLYWTQYGACLTTRWGSVNALPLKELCLMFDTDRSMNG